ncbi:MAG: L-glutamate gamma-semialdehyde dehydrogenase [Candidatus Heimdallarchaeota archaeon]|nr:L-glutamate gamma-semialdehyde dehydrogenase [Candidatus Heimdallarchaeota archaeon]
MTNYHVPKPNNEPVLSYLFGSPELNTLQSTLEEMKSQTIEVPLRIGDKKIMTDDKGVMVMPHNHAHVLGHYAKATTEHLDMAINAAKEAKDSWESLPSNDRASVFLKAAELLATTYRPIINAATMLGQSKNVLQAEIDSACELIDFFRFNAYFAQQIVEIQPDSAKGIWNQLDYRPLEGFVLAVTPFNFTSIAGNLPSAPALMGNTVLWKPASSSVFSGHYLMDLFEAAGLPPGVINFIPGKGSSVGNHLLPHPDLAGIHFTGSTKVFRHMWTTVGQNIASYKSYPRIVGETGGKDFIFAHASADIDELVTAAIRGSFEYAGQKCSASSRMYVPKSIWPEVKMKMLEELAKVKMGDPTNLDTFVNAVIDRNAFESIARFISYTDESADAEIIHGGKVDDSVGYFIEPTIIVTTDPHYKTMEEEIFGPVLSIFPYENDKFDETLQLCDSTSPYALTGAVFAKDRNAIAKVSKALRQAAGNFYINDKPTGALVNQQPFGGARASGTNDKAGSILNLIRWTSPRTIKENFNPPTEWSYPYMQE